MIKVNINKLVKCSLLFGVTLTLLVGCAEQFVLKEGELPGFFTGLTQGFFIVIAFIASLFSDIQIYTYPNEGGWYDFGYVIGVITVVAAGTSKS
ncbi:hypothetical protein F0521_17170 [Ferrimonas sp. YFM]|nr:hypothetical protein F0521_17170 [Ferrimonas sp. YFM]